MNIKHQYDLLKLYSKIFLGKSYWHQKGKLGKAYLPSKLHGYFFDLTGKADWTGDIDSNGIMIINYNGQKIYHPVAIINKCLGHWDMWLLSNCKDKNHIKSFNQSIDWLLNNQDLNGGWSYEKITSVDECMISDYSAMAQGMAASALMRAYTLTNNNNLIVTARKGLEFCLKPLSDGGQSYYDTKNNITILLEFVTKTINPILNGWIFALFGIYDFLLIENDQKLQHSLSSTIESLVENLPKYNAGYWSYYDLENRNIASPFYQTVHIAQLKALEKTFLTHQRLFKKYRILFQKQYLRNSNKIRAILNKIRQKSKTTKPFIS